jgi:hypothetical protein
MRRVLATEAAELAHLDSLGRLLLVLRRAVVTPLALGAGEGDDVTHKRSLNLVNLVDLVIWLIGCRRNQPDQLDQPNNQIHRFSTR